ncbi:MAG: DUF2934 domain-containing protein [Deltaproteobacteria bacterium]|nr:DUF2934 domain-containing protein [Deltaproteobacteria bacterium]
MSKITAEEISNLAPNRDDAVRARAYEIWLAEGKPSGREMEHWFLAEREVCEQASCTPKKARSSKTKKS